MHTQKGSVIKHLGKKKHNIPRSLRKDILKETTVLATCMDTTKLIMSEAVLIKEKRPTLNSQNEGCERNIQIFVHKVSHV